MAAYRSRQSRSLDDAVADNNNGIVNPAQGVMQNKLTNSPVFIDGIRLPGPHEKSCSSYRKDNEPETRPAHARTRKWSRRPGFGGKIMCSVHNVCASGQLCCLRTTQNAFQ